MTAGPRQSQELHEVRFLGTRVHLVDRDELLQAIENAVEDGRRFIVGNHNLHSLYLLPRHPLMQEFYERADLIHVDGMGAVLAGRIAGVRVPARIRTTYLDLLPHLLSMADRGGWKIYFLGSRAGVSEEAGRRIRSRFHAIRFEGHHGYFPVAEEDRVLRAINEFRPHILMIGMGMPRQEEWVVRNHGQLPTAVIMTCGAAMDYVAGMVPSPPRWSGRVGLEWLFRLAAEPRRLAGRYLREPPAVLLRAVAERVCLPRKGWWGLPRARRPWSSSVREGD